MRVPLGKERKNFPRETLAHTGGLCASITTSQSGTLEPSYQTGVVPAPLRG
jgi:hypothetical protein